MVTVKFYCGGDGSIHFAARGHAGAAPRGQDLICAGVSSLVWALGSAVERMYEGGMLERYPRVEIAEGEAEIIAVPKREAFGAAAMAFWTVQNGLGALAERYPEYVGVEEVMRL